MQNELKEFLRISRNKHFVKNKSTNDESENFKITN